MCPFLLSTARLCEVVGPALPDRLSGSASMLAILLPNMLSSKTKLCKAVVTVGPRHCRQQHETCYGFHATHTSNLINNCIKRIVLVDSIHSLLGVIHHLICTQILQWPGSLNNDMDCTFLLFWFDILGTDRGSIDITQQKEIFKAPNEYTRGLHMVTFLTAMVQDQRNCLTLSANS